MRPLALSLAVAMALALVAGARGLRRSAALRRGCALATLAVLVVAAGCVAPAANETPASVQDATAPTPASTPIERLPEPAPIAPLHAGLATDAPAWIENGTSVNVTLALPADARDSTVTWATISLSPSQAGPMVDTGSANAAKYLRPGQSQTLRFPLSGVWSVLCQAQHDMTGNVTVLEGYQAPARVDVDMWDDRFVPENVTVAPDTLVVYHDRGAQPHTATATLATGRAVALAAPSANGGPLVVTGDGWTRVVAIATQDASGRSGAASFDVYVAPIPRFAAQTIPIDFTTTQDAPIVKTFTTGAGNGTLRLNYTVQDALSAATSGAAPNLALVTVKLAGTGLAAAAASENKSADKMALPIGPGTWSVTILPEQGAKITGTLALAVAYDLTPPPQTR